jgi:hypothetical protein
VLAARATPEHRFSVPRVELYVVWPTRRLEPGAVRLFREALIAGLPASILRRAGSSPAAALSDGAR